MIKSMTGYGKRVLSLSDKKISLEIKSLNSKGLDLNMRIPSSYREHELSFRKRVSATLERGKIDFGLFIEQTGGATAAVINQEVVQAYMAQLGAIAAATPDQLLALSLKLPDTLSVQKEEIDPAELDAINTLLEETLAAMDQSRIDEGALLSEEFSLRINNIHQLLQQVIDMDAARMGGIKPRLEKALSDITAPIDQNRLEQELIYYIEKYDITEEKVRLAGHLDYFSETQSSSESQGKKLGFIAQEIGREINTLGSKANFAPMQQLVVQMKDELEKIKEQLLNAL
ncbi:MAG: YicC family protein [Bacteroidetes bacterium]|nr:YicC family protein [Bacteroidota bacterium]MDA1144011.1 YicC family protein [Bacteroidota bacterium]